MFIGGVAQSESQARRNWEGNEIYTAIVHMYIDLAYTTDN